MTTSGGGVPYYGDPGKPDVRLGDVVVGLPDKDHPGVTNVEYGREEDGTFVATGNILAPNDVLFRKAVAIIDSTGHDSPEIDNFRRNASELLAKCEARHPGTHQDLLFKRGYNCTSLSNTCPSACDEAGLFQRRHRADAHSKLYGGLIASSSKVIRDSGFRDTVMKQDRKRGDILCVEMEGYAIALQKGCLNIRGISDYADSHKSDCWQKYASVQAAAFAKTVICMLGESCASETSEHISRVQASSELLQQLSSHQREAQLHRYSTTDSSAVLGTSSTNFSPTPSRQTSNDLSESTVSDHIPSFHSVATHHEHLGQSPSGLALVPTLPVILPSTLAFRSTGYGIA